MSRFEQQWQKLTALARQAPAQVPTLPPGFADRVAARRARIGAASPWLTLEQFAFRGFVAAAACCAASAAFNYLGFFPEGSDEVPTDVMTFNSSVDVS